MTHERDIERLLDHWFADGPSEAPDRVIDVVADRIARQSQRPGWRLDRRTIRMTPTLKFGAAIAAVVVIGLVTFTLLRGGSTPQVAAPSATPSVAPSPAAGSASTCVNGTTDCAGALPAGDHTSAQFQPGMTFTTTAGWENNEDVVRGYRLVDTGTAPFPEINVMSQAAIDEQNATCTPTPKAGAGATVQDFVDFLTSHPGLIVTTPQKVDIGGFQGQSVVVRLASSWNETCPDIGSPYAFLITDTGSPPTRMRGLQDVDALYLTFLDVKGTTVIVYVAGPSDKTAMDSVIAAAQPVIDSMRFTPTN